MARHLDGASGPAWELQLPELIAKTQAEVRALEGAVEFDVRDGAGRGHDQSHGKSPESGARISSPFEIPAKQNVSHYFAGAFLEHLGVDEAARERLRLGHDRGNRGGQGLRRRFWRGGLSVGRHLRTGLERWRRRRRGREEGHGSRRRRGFDGRGGGGDRLDSLRPDLPSLGSLRGRGEIKRDERGGENARDDHDLLERAARRGSDSWNNLFLNLWRSEEHTSNSSHRCISYAVF